MLEGGGEEGVGEILQDQIIMAFEIEAGFQYC